MDTRSPDQHSPLSEKQLHIDAITQRDRQVFTEWAAAHSDQPRLDLSPDAARYFIPKSLLGLTNPDNVQVRISRSEKDELELFIIEKMPTAISNPESILQFEEELRASIRSDGKRPQPPSDVDLMHAVYVSELKNAGITAHDKILLAISLEQFKRDELYVRNYDDREELRGKGVAQSAYQRIAEIGLALNERYITGRNQNTPENPRRIDFFLEKLGRSRFSDLQGELKRDLYERHWLRDDQFAEQFTISFLHPQERAVALGEPKSRGKIRTILASLTHHPVIPKPRNSNS